MPISSSFGEFDTMTALDATFFDIETARTPMHVGALSIFDGAPFRTPDGDFRLEEVRAHVAGRLHLVPGLRRRAVSGWCGVGRPVWVDDDAFDITRHVCLRHLPRPGDETQLASVCAELQMELLDRDHPLWELWFIDGLDDGSVAVVEKVHHAMVDGVADVDLAAALLDLEPTQQPAPPGSEAGWTPRPLPSETQLLARAGVELVATPARWLLRTASLLTDSSRAEPGIGGLADAVGSLLGRERPVRTSLARPVGPRRSLHWVRRPLPSLLDAAHRRDVTLNDLALAAVTAGVRRLLSARGELPLASAPLALVPVSTRAPDQHDAAGNRVAALLVPLPVDVDGSENRLEAVRDASSHHKARHVPEGATLLVDAMDAVPAPLLRRMSRLVHHQPLVDLVVTNVPGPPVPLWFGGARMRSTVPVVPLAGNLTVSVAILSYDGVVTFGLFADADSLPDIDELVTGIADELDAFIAGNDGRAASEVERAPRARTGDAEVP